jgi:uncharacterized protein
MTNDVGAVKALWRFPVKSLLGEQLDAAELTPRGFVGDRRYALIDTETGNVLSGKTPRLGPMLFGCRAALVDSSLTSDEHPAVRITLGDGTSITSDAPDVGTVLSRYLGREVTLAQAAPEDFSIDQYHPDLEDLDPEGHRDTVTESKLGAAFFAEVGAPSPVPVDAFFDLFPVSVLTTATLDRLQALRPDSTFDARRFRMNVIVDADEEGFVENDWIGRELQIGENVQLDITMPDPRCVMTTLAQDELPKDTEVLRTLTRHNRLDVAGGLYPCAGVYAGVRSSGTIRVGDHVLLE